MLNEGDSAVYGYDAFDNLVTSTTVNANGKEDTAWYRIDREHRVYEQHFVDVPGSPNDYRQYARKLFAPGVDKPLSSDWAIDYLAAGTDETKLLWTITDHQGTVAAVFSQPASGSPEWQHIRYDAFGKPLDQSGLASHITTLYAGRDYEPLLQIYNNRSRW